MRVEGVMIPVALDRPVCQMDYRELWTIINHLAGDFNVQLLFQMWQP